MLHILAILCSSYSGSTILGLMLGAHTKIAMLGELHSFARGVGCTVCRKGDCPVWTQELRATLAAHRYPHRIVAERLGVEYIVDSSKLPPPDLDWYETTYDRNAEYLLIHISKAPERLAASFLLRPTYYKPVSDSIELWVRLHETCEAFIKIAEERGAKSLRVRYEDVVLHPQRELKRILSVFHLGYEPGQEYFWNYDHHQLGGNTGALSSLSPLLPKEGGICNLDEPVNTALSTEGHRKLHLDEKWRDHLTPANLDEIWTNEDVKRIAAAWGYLPEGELEPRLEDA